MSVRAEAGLFGQMPGTDFMLKGYFYWSERGYPGAAVKEDYGISLLNEASERGPAEGPQYLRAVGGYAPGG